MLRPIILLLACSGPICVDGHFASGDLRGFSCAKPETEVITLDREVAVREIRGRAHKLDESGPPAAEVLVEIRPLEGRGEILTARTDDRGRFKFKHMPPGRYQFKATLDGFKSVAGGIVVSSTADKGSDISLVMYLGR